MAGDGRLGARGERGPDPGCRHRCPFVRVGNGDASGRGRPRVRRRDAEAVEHACDRGGVVERAQRGRHEGERGGVAHLGQRDRVAADEPGDEVPLGFEEHVHLGRDAEPGRLAVRGALDLAVDAEQVGVLAREAQYEALGADLDQEVPVGDPALQRADRRRATGPPRHPVEQRAELVGRAPVHATPGGRSGETARARRP